MKSIKNVTYMKASKVKAELVTIFSAYIQVHWKHFKNSHYRTHALYNVSYFLFHECPPGGGSGFRSWRGWLSSRGGSDLGVAQNSLEVWTFTWWKGEPLEMNGLDAAQGFESGRNIYTLFMKDCLGNHTLEATSHVTGCSEESPWLWRT